MEEKPVKLVKRGGRPPTAAGIERRRVARELGITPNALQQRAHRAKVDASLGPPPPGLGPREARAYRERQRLEYAIRRRLLVLQRLLGRILHLGGPWWAERLEKELGRAMADIERERPSAGTP